MNNDIKKPKVYTIVLCGGCFWCTEAIFKELKGIIKVTSGYIGGENINPTYSEVSSGSTGHAEGIKIEYDENIISTLDILTVFLASHDPTTLNRQGADIGTQYRSAIFYSTENQKIIAKKIIDEINIDTGDMVVTQILPQEKFYSAEEYHENYYTQNKDKNPYCQVVINPKLEKLHKRFAELLKE